MEERKELGTQCGQCPAWYSQRGPRTLNWLVHTLALSANYMPGPISGAGEIVIKTGLPCPEEVAQERGDNEKNDHDLERN